MDGSHHVAHGRCAQHRHIINAAFIGEHVGQRDRMVDVGRRGDVLATLVAVLVRGEGEGENQAVHGRAVSADGRASL